MLIAYWAFSVLCLSVATVLYVNAAWVSYDWVNDNTETVYDINFLQSWNQSDDFNRIYVTWTDTSSTVVVASGTIISQYYDEWSENFWNVNVATWYSQILWWSWISVNSDNITVLWWNTNVVETGNDNLTILWWRWNTILGWSNWWSPVVVVGWSGNQVGISQDGTIIIWWWANVMSGWITNAQILWWERNEVGADNVTVAGADIKNNMSNTFVFSDGEIWVFVPSTPNAF